jgi:predicted nucleic acid-binding protein
MSKVIIDTCAWIDFFRNPNNKVGDMVATLVERDQAAITGPVLSELLQGLKNQRESKILGELFQIIPFVEVILSDWEETGSMLWKLRRKGTIVPLSDALIAVVAKRKGFSVLTFDRHFEHLEVSLHPY